MENQKSILEIVENINLSIKGIPITFESIADKFVYLNQKLAANNPNKNAILVWITDNVLPYYKTAKQFDLVFKEISESIKSQVSSGNIIVPTIAKTKNSSVPKKEKTTTRKPRQSVKKDVKKEILPIPDVGNISKKIASKLNIKDIVKGISSIPFKASSYDNLKSIVSFVE